jgi:hypothetical protein
MWWLSRFLFWRVAHPLALRRGRYWWLPRLVYRLSVWCAVRGAGVRDLD